MIGRHKSLLALSSVVAIAVALALPAFSYLPEFTSVAGKGPVMDHWDFSAPVLWHINTQTQGNIANADQRPLEKVIQDSFQTWLSAPNAALNVTEGAVDTSPTPMVGSDGTNLICFVCKPPNGFTGAETLAITITTTDGNGRITDADIAFNPCTAFAT